MELNSIIFLHCDEKLMQATRWPEENGLNHLLYIHLFPQQSITGIKGCNLKKYYTYCPLEDLFNAKER